MSPHWRPKLKIRSDERCRNFCCFRLSNVVLSMFRLWIFHYHQTWHRLADKNLKWTSRHRHSRRGLWSNPFSSSIPDFLLTVVCNIPSKLKGFQRIRRLTHSKLITTKLINDRSKLDFVAIAMWQKATLILWVWIDTDPKSSGDGRIKPYANVLNLLFKTIKGNWMDQRLALSIRCNRSDRKSRCGRQPKISAPDINVTFPRYRDTCV